MNNTDYTIGGNATEILVAVVRSSHIFESLLKLSIRKPALLEMFKACVIQSVKPRKDLPRSSDQELENNETSTFAKYKGKIEIKKAPFKHIAVCFDPPHIYTLTHLHTHGRAHTHTRTPVENGCIRFALGI